MQHGFVLGPTAYVGVLLLQLAIPGARSLKDRRQVVSSLRDRIRARFDVSCHDVDDADLHVRAALLVTSGGNDPQVLASTLDRIRAFASAHAGCVVTDAPSEVRRWPDPVVADGLEHQDG